MKIPLYTVDAFTDKPFSGNPAAVCILDNPLEESLMKKIAFEMNLSETAFLHKENDGYGLRWFTPAVEVDLCGHATLASSHILWESDRLKSNEAANFHTRSGLLTAVRNHDAIELNFPLIEESEIKPLPELEKALGAKPIYTGMTKWNYIVEFDSEDTVRSLNPDFDLLQSLPAWGTIVTAKASIHGYDFVSRFFAPEKGIKEDPVTGSAHCVLGPFWQKRLNKNVFKAYQVSQRGGTVGVKVENSRVHLSGKAVTVLSGEIQL
jgi:PhzF family phenazine biosynthesis protein